MLLKEGEMELKTVLAIVFLKMLSILLQDGLPQEALNGLGEQTGEAAGTAGEAVLNLAGNPAVLVGGIVLVVAAFLIFFFLKKIIVNSVLGAVGWAVLYFVLGVNLPLLPSLAVSIIFGLGGLGAMLVLKFFGLF